MKHLVRIFTCCLHIIIKVSRAGLLGLTACNLICQLEGEDLTCNYSGIMPKSLDEIHPITDTVSGTMRNRLRLFGILASKKPSIKIQL